MQKKCAEKQEHLAVLAQVQEDDTTLKDDSIENFEIHNKVRRNFGLNLDRGPSMCKMLLTICGCKSGKRKP